MKRYIKQTLVVCLVIIMTFSPQANAFLGFGDIVFDPSNFEEAVQQLLQMEMQYEQLVQHYVVLKNQYEHMRRMAQIVPVNMVARYKALATPWRQSSASNIYGTTGGWTSSINTGFGVASGYAASTERLGQYGNAFSNIPADQQERVKTSYATVELADGANLATIDTVGRLRANATDVERAIQGLEEDSLSGDPNMNTEIAVLNKINAANLIGVRNSQDTNKLLVALAESHAVEAKRARDAEARAINNHIRFVAEGKAAMAAQSAQVSEAMLAWRLP